MTVYKRLLQAVKWFFMGVVATVLMLLLVFTIGGYLFSAPYYDGPASNHFDGERFFNPNGALANKSFRELIRWQFNRKVGPWRDWVDSRPGSPPPGRVTKGNMRVTFINHATLLVQLDGVNVLTDPIWSERASPLPWIGPRRVRNPGIRFEDLPPIEAVVLSHNHYDHTDLPTLQRLQRSHDPVFYCHLGNKALLEQAGISRIVEMDWWDAYDINGLVKVHSVPAQHFSARGTFDQNRTLWGGYVLSGPAGNLFFAGDTGMGPHFDEIRQRFGPIRMSLLPIGAFRPEWFMKEAHISPDEAVEAHRRLSSSTSMAIHYGTFHLGDDGETEPVERLHKAMKSAGVSPARFWVMEFGEGRDIPPIRR
jgi:L-ascorbate metabolism protein UlaG (beta-lactamase superfamily)